MKNKILICLLGVGSSLFLLAINFYSVYPWFFGNGPVNIGSIEVSYVSMGRFLVDFFPNYSFAPYWYFGFPFHLFYTPLLPVLEALLNWLFAVPLWQTYRLVTGFGYIFAPVSLFLFVWALTKKIIPGIFAGLLFSFIPSLFYFVLPSGEVAADTFSREAGFYDPRRLMVLVRWGEGPHTLSLVFLPLAGLFFFRFLEQKKQRDLLLTAIFISLAALTNAVGFYALIFLLLAVFFASWVKRNQHTGTLIGLTIAVFALSYGLMAFWYNLSFIPTFFGEGGGAINNYLNLLPWGIVGLVAVIAGFYFFCQKLLRNKALIISLTWFLIVFLIVYIYYTSAPPELSFQRLEFAPQALRLAMEVDMALAALAASLLAILISLLENKLKLVGKVFGLAFGVVGIAGILIYGLIYAPYAQKNVSKQIDLSQTGEYEVANWLNNNIDQSKGERAYVAGNYSFYLNYFTNIWQLRGGLYQAKTHPWPEHIYYQITNGEDSDVALNWLKAANTKYLVVNTPTSRELYKEFKYPEKFENLPVVYENEGDIIYQVPLLDSSPAKVVNVKGLNLKPPQKADDEKPLSSYVGWLEQSSPAIFEVVNNDRYKIKAKVGQGEGILVQMTYDKGFSAKASDGTSIQITRDPLGFMFLTPERAGNLEIDLVHKKTWDIWPGYLITLATIAGILWLMIKKVKRN
ncbi:MAG: hypothetical protein Q7S03_00095 [bacterium]|nr:hypothetical protein [bacterium]